jgi:hypothetical protein
MLQVLSRTEWPRTNIMTSHAIAVGAAAPPTAKLWTLPESGLAVFHGHPKTPRLFHYFLPGLIAAGKSVLCFDGANRFDPLLIARFARRSGQSPALFDRHLRVARAFTCFQLTELLARAPRLLRNFPAEVLIVTALPDLYFDEDVRELDATASFRQALEALKLLPLVVAVFSGADSFRTPRQKFFQHLCAQANQVRKFAEQEDGGFALVVEKDAPRICA